MEPIYPTLIPGAMLATQRREWEALPPSRDRDLVLAYCAGKLAELGRGPHVVWLGSTAEFAQRLLGP